MANMFKGCTSLTNLNLSRLDKSSVTTMLNMFNGCTALTTLDLSGLDTSKVTTMANMFKGCTSLTNLNLSGLDTSKVTTMKDMFNSAENLTTIYVGTKWNTENVTNSADMFNGCTKLIGGNNTACDGENNINKTYAVIDKDGQQGYLTGVYTLTLPDQMEIVTDANTNMKVGNRYLNNAVVTFKAKAGYVASNVQANSTDLTEENGIYTVTMLDTDVVINADFYGGSYFDSITGTLTLKGNVSKDDNGIILPDGVNKNNVLHIKVDDSGATLPQNSSHLFDGFNNVTSIDLTNADTSSVTDMKNMFYNCRSLTTLNVSSFDTSNVTDMSGMFFWCQSLTSLDVSKFKTSSVTNMNSMFYYHCPQLKRLKNIYQC